MAHWETACRWLIRLVLGGSICLLASCGGPGGEGCGGVDTRVSCVSITNIEPTDGNGTTTNDVDVTFNQDCNGDGTRDDPEPFTRHDATVTFSNQTFPTAEEPGLSVTIRSVTVSYSLLTCPAGAVCPPLTGFTENVNFSILIDTTNSGTFSLVPISVKNEFTTQGGSTTAFPTYGATYTFTGTTDFFGDTITIQGSTPIVLGGFNNCE